MFIEKKRVVGFTLVELLVVISIIAMLLAILLPALSRAREQGRKIVCGTNIKNLTAANQMYATTNNGKFVPIINYGDAWKGVGKIDNGILWGPCWWLNRDFMTYLGVLLKNQPKTAADLVLLPSGYYCQSDKRNLRYHPEYQQWYWVILLSYSPNGMGIIPASQRELGYISQRVKQPGLKLMYSDGMDFVLTTAYSDPSSWDKYGETVNRNLRMNSISYRHTGGAQVGFFDGHVAYMKKQKVYELGKNGYELDNNLKKLWLPDPSLQWVRQMVWW